jgi:hypothetical protein
MKRRLVYLAVAIVCVALGLLVRWPSLGLPREVAKYAGSILWAAMVYFLLRVIALRWSVTVTAAVAAVLVALGEATQLISIPWFDAMRATTLGHLIFGRTFAFEDIVAYWIGILLAAAGEWATVGRAHERKPRR